MPRARRSLPSSLVQAMEVWVPTDDGERLVFGTGSYGTHERLRTASPPVVFARGQGLPGQVYARRVPLVFEDLTAERGFVRAELAHVSGLSAGVGMPVLFEERVVAVVTLLLAMPPGTVGAVEVWGRDGVEERLVWKGGGYAGCAAFEAAGREATFAPGEGLPGHVLRTGRPVLFDVLSAERGFGRAAAAAVAGLQAGLGIPFAAGGAVEHVVLLLTSHAAPLARVMEVWRPRDDGVLTLDAGYYGALDAFRQVSERTTFAPGRGLPGQVLVRRAPVLFERLNRRSGFVRAEAAARAGLQAAVGIPVFDGVAVASVVVLFH